MSRRPTGTPRGTQGRSRAVPRRGARARPGTPRRTRAPPGIAPRPPRDAIRQLDDDRVTLAVAERGDQATPALAAVHDHALAARAQGDADVVVAAAEAARHVEALPVGWQARLDAQAVPIGADAEHPFGADAEHPRRRAGVPRPTAA